jgi:hypothetical protein
MSTINQRPSAIAEIFAGMNGIGTAIAQSGSTVMQTVQALPKNIAVAASTVAAPIVSTVSSINPVKAVSYSYAPSSSASAASAASAASLTKPSQSWFSSAPTQQQVKSAPAKSTQSWFSGTSATPPKSSWYSNAAKPAAATIPYYLTHAPRQTGSSSNSSAYWLHTLYFFTLYIFFIFLILTVVNYTVMPIFSFYPGSDGVFRLPGNTNDLIYWDDKAQPPFSDPVPKVGDKLHGQPYVNMFSFSADLFVRQLENSKSTSRLILYKSSAPIVSPTMDASFTADSFINYMQKQSSLIMYLTETNDLMVTIFSGSMQFNIAPVKNVPLHAPFRITVVVEDKMFTVYLNNKQVFQRILPGLIGLPTGVGGNQLFHFSPDWANKPQQTVFIQNFHLWARVITYKEILNAKPALALATDFGLSPETLATCTNASTASVVANSAQSVVDGVKSVLGTP